MLQDGHRRDGGLKTRWTEPLRRCCAMGIEWRAVSSGTWDAPSGQVPRESIRGVGAGQGDERATPRQRTRVLRPLRRAAAHACGHATGAQRSRARGARASGS